MFREKFPWGKRRFVFLADPSGKRFVSALPQNYLPWGRFAGSDFLSGNGAAHKTHINKISINRNWCFTPVLQKSTEEISGNVLDSEQSHGLVAAVSPQPNPGSKMHRPHNFNSCCFLWLAGEHSQKWHKSLPRRLPHVNLSYLKSSHPALFISSQNRSGLPQIFTGRVCSWHYKNWDLTLGISPIPAKAMGCIP